MQNLFEQEEKTFEFQPLDDDQAWNMSLAARKIQSLQRLLPHHNDS